MYCCQCGQQLPERANFCSNCGTACGRGTSFAAPHLYRPRGQRMIGGVCAAFALHFGWELALTRIVTVLIACLYPPAVIAYVAAWIIIPQQCDFAAAPGQAVHSDLQPH